MHRYFIIYKPYQVLSQFSESGDKKILKDFFKVPADVYPVAGWTLTVRDFTIDQ